MSVPVCVCVWLCVCACLCLSSSRSSVTVAKYAKTVNLYSILQKGHITNTSEWAGDRSITLSIAAPLPTALRTPTPAVPPAYPKLHNTAATDQANWHSAFENWSPEHPCADRKCANATATASCPSLSGCDLFVCVCMCVRVLVLPASSSHMNNGFAWRIESEASESFSYWRSRWIKSLGATALYFCEFNILNALWIWKEIDTRIWKIVIYIFLLHLGSNHS